MTSTASPVTEWMSALAESSGSPGGGAASALMLGVAAGLTSMVAGYNDQPDMVQRARRLQQAALELADADAAVSEAFGTAFREHGDTRQASLRAAGSSAALGDLALEAVADVEWLAEHGRHALVADVAVARAALRAALVGARANLEFDLDAGGGIHTALIERLDAAIARLEEPAR